MGAARGAAAAAALLTVYLYLSWFGPQPNPNPNPDQVWRQLLQRLWTDALCRLRQALGTTLFSPSEIGARFCGVVSDLLREMGTLVHRGGSGPSREWMQRRAAGLQATLALRDLSTARLVEVYHGLQDSGSTKQLAPLALLAMRMDQAHGGP